MYIDTSNNAAPSAPAYEEIYHHTPHFASGHVNAFAPSAPAYEELPPAYEEAPPAYKEVPPPAYVNNYIELVESNDFANDSWEKADPRNNQPSAEPAVKQDLINAEKSANYSVNCNIQRVETSLNKISSSIDYLAAKLNTPITYGNYAGAAEVTNSILSVVRNFGLSDQDSNKTARLQEISYKVNSLTNKASSLAYKIDNIASAVDDPVLANTLHDLSLSLADKSLYGQVLHNAGQMFLDSLSNIDFSTEQGRIDFIDREEETLDDIQDNIWRYQSKLNTYFLSNIAAGQENTSFALLNLGANINTTNYKGKTALEMSLSFQNNDLLKKLLDHGANPNITDSTNHTLLDHTILNKDAEKVKILLDHDAKIQWDSHYKPSSIHLAAEVGNQEIMKSLLNHGGKEHIDVSLYKWDGYFNWFTSGVKSWFVTSKTAGTTPLHAAMQNQNHDVVELLEQYGANQNILDEAGHNYEHYAPVDLAIFGDYQGIDFTGEV